MEMVIEQQGKGGLVKETIYLVVGDIRGQTKTIVDCDIANQKGLLSSFKCRQFEAMYPEGRLYIKEHEINTDDI
jgi:hypothetical protein